MLNNKIVLVTGGTGSWGHEVVRQILEKFPDVKQIRIYSRGEHKQVDMRQLYAGDARLKFIVGDVRDKPVLEFAMSGADFVFHLAALKHVPVCEDNSWESVLTNVIGTQNVIECAIRCEVATVVDISTDKAVDPFNIYGITKACGEKLMINSNYNYPRNTKTKFVCIRGGNVLGTNGSVIPLFKKQILEKNEITVTDPKMTRYLMSTRQAVSLIFTAVENAVGGELFVMRMPATTVEIMAKAMIEMFGNKETKIKIIGVRPGEKMHEVLVSKNESATSHQFSDDYFLVRPQIVDKKLQQKYDKLPKMQHPEFTSQNAKQLSQAELVALLKKEKWLFN